MASILSGPDMRLVSGSRSFCVKGFVSLVIYSLVGTTPLFAQQPLDPRAVCGTASEEVSGEIKGSLTGKAQTFARIGTVELEGEASRAKRDIEIRENRSDAARELHYLNYISCMLIYQDKTLSTDEKLKRIAVLQTALTPSVSEPPAVVSWPMTGDPAIDQAHQNLNNLQHNKQLSESTVVAAMRPLFYKPVFHQIQQERDIGKALFGFCRAELLLEAYVGYFSSPGVRRVISAATDNLISLQDQLAQLFGPTFNRDAQCKNATSLQSYVSALPPRQSDLNSGQISKANITLRTLDGNLHYVNLID
jgi:hypothetical protein